uniref:Uncharacterized protein n=1 Tax=Steinernema glaseri TaxID=37863 RepID=A0A1I7YQ54_9BILA
MPSIQASRSRLRVHNTVSNPIYSLPVGRHRSMTFGEVCRQKTVFRLSLTQCIQCSSTKRFLCAVRQVRGSPRPAPLFTVSAPYSIPLAVATRRLLSVAWRKSPVRTEINVVAAPDCLCFVWCGGDELSLGTSRRVLF